MPTAENFIDRIEKVFLRLSPFLREGEEAGLMLAGTQDVANDTQKGGLPSLKYYFADESTEEIILHNVRWARGEEEKPIFQFAYIMLPNGCNQACRGCFMGQDKLKLPPHLDGPFFPEQEIDKILDFLIGHGAKALVYGGGGELFTWPGAMDFVKKVYDRGLKMVIFTNGTLLTREMVSALNALGAVLIVSMRDTAEKLHDEIVGNKGGFVSTLKAIEYALEEGMSYDNRLAVEIPVTVHNEKRVLNDLLPVLRSLQIVPIIEEYIQISVSEDEKMDSHNFSQSRAFFKEACCCDLKRGLQWEPEVGSRMIGQPQCRRPLYSFAVFPSRDVLDCPSHSICYGNLKNNSLEEIIYSDLFKQNILNFKLCACSVFYTPTDDQILKNLPDYLETFK
ncbi:MAG: radical SAM protein [Thermodesulfovibrionales bacterium]